MYWLSGVVLVVLSFCARVNSGAVSAIAEKCKAAGSKKIVLCSAIGFSGTDGNAVYESVFGEGFGDQIVIARDELDLDNGNSDIAVAMVKIVELNGDLNGLQVAMQNSMEAAMYRGQTTKLIVILSGREESDSDRKRVTSLAEDVWSMIPKPEGAESKVLADYTEIIVHGIAHNDASSVAASVKGALVGVLAVKTGAEVASTINQRISSSRSSREVSAAESRAVADCSTIAEDFLQDLRSRLTDTVLPTSAIAMAVSKSLTENYEKHAKSFEMHAQSDALRAASYRAQAGLSAILQPYYRRTAGSLKINSLKAFEVLILRVAPNSRLVSALKSQAAAIFENFRLKASDIKREFSVMFDGVVITEELIEVEVPAPAVEKAAEEELEVESEDGGKEEKEEEEVVAPAPVEAKVNVAKKVPAASNILSGPWVSGDRSRGCAGWGLGSELNSLRTDLAESCAERERFLFLSGAYNPYVRDMPIPPTKLSFNYLLDPKGVSYGRGYDVLYDEQTDGLAERRAYPLILPGMAEIPFDPNDHPVPKDTTPWWQVIVDFYKGDPEE